MRTLDSNYEDWKVGDSVVWEVDPYVLLPLDIVGIDRENGIIYYKTSNGGKNQIKREYLMRVTETETSKEGMADLEKLINDLCEMPSATLEGNSDISVRYATSRPDQPFLSLEDWNQGIYLDPTQALALHDYLGSQRQNLELLRDALQAKQVEDEATKEQRAAERLNALKALHSDAVVAWQQGGSVEPCPSFEDIVRKEQFVRVDLFDESADAIPVAFVKQYPMLERLREGQRG